MMSTGVLRGHEGSPLVIGLNDANFRVNVQYQIADLLHPRKQYIICICGPANVFCAAVALMQVLDATAREHDCSFSRGRIDNAQRQA